MRITNDLSCKIGRKYKRNNDIEWARYLKYKYLKNTILSTVANYNISILDLYYFIKENNSNRTCNFNRFTSNKVAAVNFSFDYDGYIIVSNNNKYTLSIKKSEDLFGSIEDWNQFKISGHLISSQMIVNHYNESDYVLTISERNNNQNNYIYISNVNSELEIV